MILFIIVILDCLTKYCPNACVSIFFVIYSPYRMSVMNLKWLILNHQIKIAIFNVTKYCWLLFASRKCTTSSHTVANFLLILKQVIVLECGEVVEVNGTSEDSRSFPWYVGIYKKRSTDAIPTIVCAGSIISSNKVVSGNFWNLLYCLQKQNNLNFYSCTLLYPPIKWNTVSSRRVLCCRWEAL